MVKKPFNKLRSDLQKLITDNPNIFTGALICVILVSGGGLVSGQKAWLLSGIGILLCFALLFAFLKARVFLKATLSIFTVMIISNFSLQAGVMISPTTVFGIIWPLAVYGLFFFMIAISYITIGHKSRWTGITMAIITQFFISGFSMSTNKPYLAVSIGTIVAFLLFMVYYKLWGSLNSHYKNMPTNVVSQELEDNLFEQVKDTSWNVRKVSSRFIFRTAENEDYIVWNDERAYLLHPVELVRKFGISPGRKSTKLMHNGYSITSWLLILNSKLIPLWRTRNAPMLLVLLDAKNTNGSKPEVIGVAIPDSFKKIPVGIYPSLSILKKSKKSNGLLDDLDSKFKEFNSPLKEKHKKALLEIGQKDGSDYLEQEED